MRLLEKYKKEVIPAMKEKFGYKNVMAVPKIEKVVINTGFGKQIVGKSAQEQEKTRDAILSDLSLIAGQKPILTLSKKSISAFKLRENLPIGSMISLRKKRMYDFLDRLIHIALPRSRDFRGIEQKSVDKNGNLTLGIREQIIFPEVSPENIKGIFGLEITVVTTAKKHETGIELLKLMGFPIKNI